MNRESNITTYFKLALSTVFWGGAFVAAKIAVQELSPVVAASIRFTLAFLVLAPILIWKEGKRALVSWKDLPLLGAAALTGIFLYNLFFFQGLRFTSPINGSLIVAAGPVITATISSLFLGEEMGIRQIWGLIISVLGVVIIVSQGSYQVLTQLRFNAGDLIITGGVFCWSLYTITGKFTSKRWSGLLTNTYACGLGGLLLLLLALPQIPRVSWHTISAPTMLALIFLAVFASAVAFVLWYDGIGKVGASRAATFQNIVPMSSALFSVLLLGEQIKLFHVFGALFILYGVYLANSHRHVKVSHAVNQPSLAGSGRTRH